MYFSIVIPVYNRPDELEELLQSLVLQDFRKPFEVVVVDDGSTVSSYEVVSRFESELNLSFYYKANSGPGDSRNFGMKKAKGDYFIIFDSDCIIPENYLSHVESALNQNYSDCFGGPDEAHPSFTSIQKAINFSMTSVLTTGGIRGASEKTQKFQPRSFNMGISKKAFEASNGFGLIHPGEDPDLSIRLWKLGFETQLISKAFVYHKRRIDWSKFAKQVYKFGKVRPILNTWHPEFTKLTFWFPTLFIIGLDIALLVMLFGIFIPIYFYISYFFILLITSTWHTKSLKIGFLSIIAVLIQFYGYGIGFLESQISLNILKKDPEKQFPDLFFKSKFHD